VDPAALAGGGKHLRYGSLDALVRIGDDELDPRRPRLVSLRRNSVQIASASDVPISIPRTSPRAAGVDAHRNDDGNGDDAPAATDLEVGRVDPE
jgi:hypothetical protein